MYKLLMYPSNKFITYLASLMTKLMTGSSVFWKARCNTCNKCAYIDEYGKSIANLLLPF